MLENKAFKIQVNKRGNLVGLFQKGDKYNMNWVVDPAYLKKCGYKDDDKLFGEFEVVTFGEKRKSIGAKHRKVKFEDHKVSTIYDDKSVCLEIIYNLRDAEYEALDFKIKLVNKTNEAFQINDFRVWTAFAHIMYRDKNVLKNINESCTITPSISKDFTRLAMVRNNNKGPNLGMYQTWGQTKSVGTYCEYSNLFFENISPSLDGILFHQLVLAGGYEEKDMPYHDWIYDHSPIDLPANSTKEWSYTICSYTDKKDFVTQGKKLGMPYIGYNPYTHAGGTVALEVRLPMRRRITNIYVWFNKNGYLQKYELPHNSYDDTGGFIYFTAYEQGEHKVEIFMDDGCSDCVVLNVMDKIPQLLKERCEYICNTLYHEKNAEVPYCFYPVSNQGESLGKLNLVLKFNILSGKFNKAQINKVEKSAVYYIKEKWFENGDFKKPVKLYGSFYRVMDFEYIAHTYFLLSQIPDEYLSINDQATYMDWALQVFELRINPDLHKLKRAKEETQMLGVFFLYAPEILEALKNSWDKKRYAKYKKLWDNIVKRVGDGADTYKGAITEHYFDNAGFGPSAGALAMNGHLKGAEKYAQLLVANIGYSNDFRAQNPHRWWEALSYMTHSLWGGISAASMLKCYEALGDWQMLDAAYYATVAILYCYDTHANACNLRLGKGEAASTYSVAGPLVNFPRISRDRFGQSVFAELGGIFAKLFANNDSTMDWDMGEELCAYLDGFGTKTFVYEADGNIYVANGVYEIIDEGYLIHSYAPFPTEYHFYDKNFHFICKKGETLDKILLTNKGFKRL